MEIEYSNEIKGKVYAYRFNVSEKKAIIKGLIPQIKILERKVEKIRNHPKNEGQVTYQVKIEDLNRLISDIKEMIDLLS